MRSYPGRDFVERRSLERVAAAISRAVVAGEEGCGLLQCAKLQRQPRSGETPTGRSGVEKRFRSRWRLGRVAQKQEIKKTLNAPRSTPNVQCSNLILPLSVGCWTLEIG